MTKYDNILIPRRIEGRAERYKRIIYQQIQQNIKNGCVFDLDLWDTPIETLPDNLIKIGMCFWLNNSKIKSLNNLEYVGDILDLTGSSIQSFGNLKSVGSDLWLGHTPIAQKYATT